MLNTAAELISSCICYDTVEPLLLWTPWGPGEVSCIKRCPRFKGKFVLRKHISKVSLPGEVSCIKRCPCFKSKFVLRKHISKVSLIQRCPFLRVSVSLYS